MLVLPHYKVQIMRTATSKLTSKYQATIPEPVRRLLHLEAGDAVAFDIDDQTVHLRKARPVDLAFAQGLEGSLTEWSSAADDEAYRDL
jgi:antitoxin PrlF